MLPGLCGGCIMTLVANWKNAWKMYSVRVALILAVLGVLQTSLPMFQDFLPPVVFASLTTLLAVAVVVGRVVYQPSLHQDDDA
jgi:hypothetical protein